VSKTDIETVKDQLTPELFQQPGVVGVGLTEKDGVPAIVVMLTDPPTDAVAAHLARMVADHPLVIQVVGIPVPFR
jgi:hypothetical protein